MKDRERFIGQARQTFANIARRIGLYRREVPIPTPAETTGEDAGNKRLWEILNVVPIVEVNSLTPSERAELERKSAAKLRAEMEFQASLNQTVEEFFGGKPK